MTRSTNARLAGFTFLFYIAVAFPSMVLFKRATSGAGLAAQLAGIAQHATVTLDELRQPTPDRSPNLRSIIDRVRPSVGRCCLRRSPSSRTH